MINLGRILRGTTKKSEDKARTAITVLHAATSFDRPASFRGFKKILKSDSLGNDRARRGFAGNSAFSTRLMGGKLW